MSPGSGDKASLLVESLSEAAKSEIQNGTHHRAPEGAGAER